MKSYNKDIHWKRITHGGVGIHPASSVQAPPHSQVSNVRNPKSITFRGSAPVWYEKWHASLASTGSCYDSPVPQQRSTTYAAVDEFVHTNLVDVDDDELHDEKETVRHGFWNDLMKKSTDKHHAMMGPVAMKRLSLDATETNLTEDSLDEIQNMNRKLIGVDGKDEKDQFHTAKKIQFVDMEICLKERRDVVDDDDFDLISTASASSSSFSMSDNFDEFDHHNNIDDEEAVAMIGSDDHFASIFNTWDADDCTATVIDDKITTPAKDTSNNGTNVTSAQNRRSSSTKKYNDDDNVSISSSFLSLTEPTPFDMPPLLTSTHWNNIDIPSSITTVDDETTKSVTDNIVDDVTMSLMDTDDTGIFDNDDNESIDFLFDDENDIFSYNIDESKELTTLTEQQQRQQKISFTDLFEERRSQLAASMAASRRTRNRCFLTDGCVGVMKRHASLSHILRDIERSSHVVARNIVLHHPNHLQHQSQGVNRCSVQQQQQQQQKQQLSSKQQ